MSCSHFGVALLVPLCLRCLDFCSHVVPKCRLYFLGDCGIPPFSALSQPQQGCTISLQGLSPCTNNSGSIRGKLSWPTNSLRGSPVTTSHAVHRPIQFWSSRGKNRTRWEVATSDNPCNSAPMQANNAAGNIKGTMQKSHPASLKGCLKGESTRRK